MQNRHKRSLLGSRVITSPNTHTHTRARAHAHVFWQCSVWILPCVLQRGGGIYACVCLLCYASAYFLLCNMWLLVCECVRECACVRACACGNLLLSSFHIKTGAESDSSFNLCFTPSSQRVCVLVCVCTRACAPAGSLTNEYLPACMPASPLGARCSLCLCV